MFPLYATNYVVRVKTEKGWNYLRVPNTSITELTLDEATLGANNMIERGLPVEIFDKNTKKVLLWN